MNVSEIYSEYSPKFGKTIEEMDSDTLKLLIEEVVKCEMPEIRAIPYIGTDEKITYQYEELTALCPMTGVQDLYSITISYTPNKFIPELKSLKFYFLEYRNLPISHEHLAYKIAKDMNDAIQPMDLSIVLEVAIRGGIKTTIEVFYNDGICTK